MRDSSRIAALTFGLTCAVVLAIEVFVVFVDRIDTDRTEGQQPYEIGEFARGSTVSHAFLMREDGLHSVSLKFSSAATALVTVEWRVFRSERNRQATQPEGLRLAFEGMTSFDLRPGRQWKTFMFTRDASSADRWYRFDIRVLDPAASANAQVSLVASRDNPERGGVLWVDDARQTGSLFLRAERQGRTLYRQFMQDGAPHFPAPLRSPVVQWSIAVALHWSVIMVAYALFLEARHTAAPGSSRAD